MTQFDDSHFSNLLAITLPDGLIEKLAEIPGATQGDHKIDIVTLVPGFDAGTTHLLASLRRPLQQHSGLSIARSPFHGLLTESMAERQEGFEETKLTAKTNTGGSR